MKILISVIMPVYNAAPYLRKAMDSVLHQTLREIEVICLDDASEDASAAILQEYAAADDRIRLVTLTERVDVGAVRNLGLDLVRGEYIAFLDADDWFEPAALESALREAQHCGADVTVFRCDQYLEEADAFISARYSIKDALLPKERPFAGRDIEKDLFNVFLSWCWDKLFRADFVRDQKLRFQEIRNDEDTCFVLEAVILAERIATNPKVLIHHRRRQGSLSASREDGWDCFYQALLELRRFLASRGLFEAREQDYINYALHYSLRVLHKLSGVSYYALYERLTSGGWLREFGLDGQDSSYFYDTSEYMSYQALSQMSAEEYLQYAFRRESNSLALSRGKLYDLSRTNRKLKEKNVRLETQLQELRKDNSAQREENVRLETQMQELRKDNSAQREENVRLETQMQELRKDNSTLRSKNKALKARNERLRKDNEAIKQSISFRIGRFLTWLPRTIRKLSRK